MGIFTALIFTTFYSCAQTAPAIRLNQLGFYPNAPKLAVVTGDSTAMDFEITSVDGKRSFFKAKLGELRKSAYSSTKTKIADFSSFHAPGKYVIACASIHSYPFEIANDVNKQVGAATLKGYFFQRVSMPLDEKYAGKYDSAQPLGKSRRRS